MACSSLVMFMMAALLLGAAVARSPLHAPAPAPVKATTAAPMPSPKAKPPTKSSPSPAPSSIVKPPASAPTPSIATPPSYAGAPLHPKNGAVSNKLGFGSVAAGFLVATLMA